MFTRKYCKSASSILMASLMSPAGQTKKWSAAPPVSPEFKPGLNICLFQWLDPGSSSDPPHPRHRGEVALAPGRWTHTGQALAASPHFCWHCGRYPWIYQRDTVRHQVSGRLCWLSWTCILILGVSIAGHSLDYNNALNEISSSPLLSIESQVLDYPCVFSRENNSWLIYLILGVWTWSMAQFPLHVTGQYAFHYCTDKLSALVILLQLSMYVTSTQCKAAQTFFEQLKDCWMKTTFRKLAVNNEN